MKSITELLDIQYPIIQGAMAQISYHPLVAAVSEAGGLGVIASGALSPEELREEIRKVKAITDKPFAVNLMLKSQNIEGLLEVIIEERVKAVTTGAGNPKPYIQRLQEAGVLVIPVIPNAKIAKKMEALGVDAVIAEGMEAGGHIGDVTSMVLWQKVSSSISIPMIAAGGIVDGRGLVAAFVLGAKGIQMGTAFLASEEAPISAAYKQAILDAEETSTIVTGKKNRAAVRSLANKMTLDYLESEESGVDLSQLETLTLGSLKKAVLDGNVDEGSFMAGQSAGLIQEIKTVKQLIESIMDEAAKINCPSF